MKHLSITLFIGLFICIIADVEIKGARQHSEMERRKIIRAIADRDHTLRQFAQQIRRLNKHNKLSDIITEDGNVSTDNSISHRTH